MKKRKLSQFLNKDYPFNNDLGHNAKIISFISVLVLLFLYFFKPFDIHAISNVDKLKFGLGIAVVTFLTLSINLLVIPAFFVKIFEKVRWKVKKEILWNLWILISVSSGYFLYFQYTNLISVSLIVLGKIVIISILPIGILITLNQNRLLRLNLKSAVELNQRLMQKLSPATQTIEFISDYKEENIRIDVEDLLVIKSANNYIEIYWLEDDELKHRIIRSSLKRAEEEVKEYRFIFRCHRTAIINVKKIEQVEGNSQGVKVLLNGLDFPVPVSRNNMNLLKELI